MKRTIYLLIFICILAGCAYDPVSMHTDSFAVVSDKSITGKLGDSVSISVSVTQPVKFVKYIWSIDGSSKNDTTFDSCYTVQWFAPDTAEHIVVVRAIDGYGCITPAETISVKLVYSIPQVLLKGPDSVSINDTATFVVEGLDDDGFVQKFFWSVDSQGVFWFAADSILNYSWKKEEYGHQTVRVRAVDNSGLKSETDSILINVCDNAPIVELSTCDTAVYVNQELKLFTHSYDVNGMVEECRWTIDHKDVESVSCDSISLNWGKDQIGSHTVIVTVTDNDSVQASDTVFVTVKKPEIRFSFNDTVMYTGEELILIVNSLGAGEVYSEFKWLIDGLQVDGFSSDTLRNLWVDSDLGVHTIIATGFNEKTGWFEPDTATIYVNYGGPKIVPLNDTIVSSNDSLILKFIAADSNGIIERYLWGSYGEGWIDSSDIAEAHIGYRDSKELVLVWGARDNDGLITKDTVHITFNRVPEISITTPVNGDTVWLSDNRKSDTVFFDCQINDPDNDPVSFSLLWGMGADSMCLVDSNDISKYSVLVNKKGVYNWKIEVQDTFGNINCSEGIITAVFRYTICFAGHSIVAGMGGDSYHGGFRKYVLDNLRDSLEEFETLKAVGPFVTSYMMNGEDDSCFAYPKSIAQQMEVIMSGCPDLNADIWVWMMGTNSLDNYNDTRNEVNYFKTLLDNSCNRNPDARVYVLNCIPFKYGTGLYSDYIGYLDIFNRWLSYRINDIQISGYDAFEIDANSLWMDENDIPDSSLFFDAVHPNQNGYEKLGKEILRVMWSSQPTVFK